MAGDGGDSTPADGSRARRGRPRDPGVDESILSSTLLLLGEVGYAQLTMEQVAARARVGKASLYLRWPSKVALVADAVQRLRPDLAPAMRGLGQPGDARGVPARCRGRPRRQRADDRAAGR
jgi:AcrR family transcriptional regulator